MRISAKVKLLLFTTLLLTSFHQSIILASSQKQSKRVIDTCSELQRRANKTWSQEGIVFQGFENLPMDRNATISNAGNDRLCQLGYITQVTPMGKEVCRGFIYTNINSNRIQSGYGFRQRTIWDDPGLRSEYCRYV
jgi:hypothetical protein